MSTTTFEKAQTFIWKNARLIDRRLFAFLFLGGTRQAVTQALKAYQNADGGFGNALEPDKRTPYSQPIDVQVAFDLLDRTGALGDPQVQRDIVLPACDFLQSVTTPAGGVPFILATTNDYPHTPWMGTDDPHPPAALNPTAQLAGLLLKYGVQHPWLDGAVAFCKREITASETEQFHDLILMVTFLQHAPDRTWAEAELKRIADRVCKPGVVALDPEAGGYVQKPLDWAPEPENFFRSLFDDATIETHLNALKARQQADGGWSITWDPISPTVELEWRGTITVSNLRTLQAYGALDN
jgi:hypothetical protein